MNRKYRKLLFLSILPFVISISACGDSSNSNNQQTGGNNDTNTQQSGTNTQSEDPLWNVDFQKYGISFRDELADLINAKVSKTTTKSKCLEIGQDAASIGDKFVPFYHGSDYAVDRSISCNREHTWPDSRGGGPGKKGDKGGSNIERDPFMLRPTVTNDNSNRGNNFYGIPNTEINGIKYKNQWDPASCGFEASRGECARVIFYVATKYGKSNNLVLSNNPDDDFSVIRSMGTLKYLVEWNKKYPVTKMEKQINDYLNNQGYGRNPFVDHPEYADYIWDENGLIESPFVQKSVSTAMNTTYTLKDAINDINRVSEIIF